MALPRLAPSAAVALLGALTLWLAAPREALADEGYTLADIVAATQRGVPREVIEEMARHPAQPWEIDHFLTLRLLRAGVGPEVLRLLSDGAHPTPEELSTASEPGEAWTPPPPEAPWETLLAHPVRLVFTDGESAEGTLLGLTPRAVALADEAGDIQSFPRDRVGSVLALGDAASGTVTGAMLGPTLPEAPPPRQIVGLTAGPLATLPPPSPVRPPPPPPAPLALGELRPAWDRTRSTMTAGAGVAVAGAVVAGVLETRTDGGTATGLASAAVFAGVGTLDLAALRQRHLLVEAGRPGTRVFGALGLTATGLGLVSWSVGSAVEGRPTWNPAAASLVGLGAAAGVAQGVQNGAVRGRLAAVPSPTAPSLAVHVVDGTPALALTGAW